MDEHVMPTGHAGASTGTGGTGTCRFSVHARHDGVVGVAVDGDLDPVAASTLLELVETAVEMPGTSSRVEIDLRKLRACSNSGVRALASCAELGAWVRDGLQFRVGIAPEVMDSLVDG
jgi:STAS domain